MHVKMTAAQVRYMIDNNLVDLETPNDEYLEIELPDWMIEMLLLLFPSWSPDESLEFICQKFIEDNGPIKLN